MSFDTSVDQIDATIQLQIPQTQFKISVLDSHDFEYLENGVGIVLIFQDLHSAAPQCRLESGTLSPLTGSTPVFLRETIWNYGTNLMFEPIPLELIYTDAQKPQVIVSVNGIDGVCPNTNCDYLYIADVGEVTSQSLSGTSLTIVGTDLPTTDFIVRISNSKCTSPTATPTQITCTLDVAPAAGQWDVKIIGLNGITPIGAAVSKISVPLTVASITPNTDLNQLGGNVLTIVGTGFDQVTDNSSVVFSDSTTCTIQTTTATQITCLVNGFDSATIDVVNPYTVTITVNAIADTSQTVSLNAIMDFGRKVVPNSVSPLKPQELVITLDNNYSERMNDGDFTCYLVSKTDPTVTRSLVIVKVSNSAKAITAMYTGADSGDYYVQVISSSIGRIDKTLMELFVGAKVTSVTPVTGSYLGGTLLTIDGENFSDDILNNSVKVGDTDCILETSSETQIICRITETLATAASQAPVVVSIRTQADARSDIPMLFDYVQPSATMTDLEQIFFKTLNSQLYIMTGTGFTENDLTSVSLYIENIPQETYTVSSTRIQFKAINTLDYYSKKVFVYFADGLPIGYSSFTRVIMTSSLYSITPSIGSSSGTLVTISGTGFGLNTKNLNVIVESTGE